MTTKHTHAYYQLSGVGCKIKQIDYFSGQNYFTERKRAMRYIYLCTLYVRFTDLWLGLS